MKADNTWPDTETYATLMAPATSALEKENRDNETDLCIPPPAEVPFSVSHLYPTLYVTSPLITEFPVQIHPLMDIGSPSTVISLKLCEQLGLQHYSLPKKENNLSSLSKQKLNCEEFVNLELQSDWGIWKLRVHRMKVNKGLSFPIILGMPFLSSKQIVIDTHEWMAIDKWSGFDLLNPPPQTPQPQGKQQVIPPLTPKKNSDSKTTHSQKLWNTSACWLLTAQTNHVCHVRSH
jgi:hypothetical protein